MRSSSIIAAMVGLCLVFASAAVLADNELDIQEIHIVLTGTLWEHGHPHMAGMSSTSSPEMLDYIAFVKVIGENITDVSVTTPSEYVFYFWNTSDGLWVTNYWFWDESEIDEIFPAGDYHFEFNGGADSATVTLADFAMPGAMPVITYPQNGDDTVPVQPTFEWESLAGMGDFLHLELQGGYETLAEAVAVDINQTQWPSPLVLEKNNYYQFICSVVNIQSGAPIAMQTDGEDNFLFYGMKAYKSESQFIVDVDLSIYWIDFNIEKLYFGNQPLSLPYQFDIMLQGAGMKKIELLAPSGITYQFEKLYSHYGPVMQIAMQFQTQQQMLDVFGYGNYVFDFNDGEDFLTVPFYGPLPDAMPIILYPGHFQSNVELDPTFQWTSVDGMADYLSGYLYGGPHGNQIDSFWGGTEKTEHQFASDLEAGQDYTFALYADSYDYEGYYSVENSLIYVYFSLGCMNYIHFDTKPSAALVIEEIEIFKNTRYVGGVFDVHEFRLEVMGSGIVSVSVKCPNNIDHVLDNYGRSFELEAEYNNIADRDTDWPAGNYTFTFNAGLDSEDTVTLPYTVSTPTAWPQILNPVHKSTGQGRSPAYEWQLHGDGTGSIIAVFLEQIIDEDEWDNIGAEVPLPIETTTWRGPHLSPSSDYILLVAVANIEGGEFQELTTDNDRPFTYVGVALQEDEVEFSTAEVLKPSIEEIQILKNVLRVGGGAPQHLMLIEVIGEGITSATVTCPLDVTYVLQPGEDPDDEWRLELAYNSIAERDAVWTAGDYDFIFNAGDDSADTVTLPFTVDAPTAYPIITNPLNNSFIYDLDPLYQWEIIGVDNEAIVLLRLEERVDDDWDELDEVFGHPISVTEWSGPELVWGGRYFFQVTLAHIQDGEFLEMVTDGNVAFTYIGASIQEDEIEFDIDTVQIESIEILKSTFRTGGIETPMPHEFEVEIRATGIDWITMKCPDPVATPYVLDQHSDDEWGLKFNYAEAAARDAIWLPGDYFFTFGAGDITDTVTLSYTMGPAAAYPTIESPMHGSENIGKNPVGQWIITGNADDSVLLVFVDQIIDDYEEELYLEFLDVTETSWQSPDLEPSSTYTFGVLVADIEGGGADPHVEMTTDNGRPFTYTGVSMQVDMAEFETAPMPVVEDIFLVRMLRSIDGQPMPETPASAMISIEGDLVSVSVEPPGKEPFELNQHYGEWGLHAEFASLQALNDSLPPGSYTFSFNGGFDSVTVDWSMAMPVECPVILSPAHFQNSVYLEPTYTWQPYTQTADALAAFVRLPDLQDEVYVNWPIDLSETTWQPGELDQFEDYLFEVGAAFFSSPGGEMLTTSEGQNFHYLGAGVNFNAIIFTTGGWVVPGDVTGDGKVDIADLIFVRNRLGAELPGEDNWLADVNRDGIINLSDLVEVRNLLDIEEVN